jgi:hypothetical protein
MSKPWIHAESSARRFGGKPEDYIEIHNLLDSSKAAMCDNRHRVLTHNAWFIGTILERIFGVTITNSENKKISVRDVGEQHVSEDFGNKFIPSVQDYLVGLPLEPWMRNGEGLPPSYENIRPKKTPKLEDLLPSGPFNVPNAPAKPVPVPMPWENPNPWKYPDPWDRPQIVD